MPFEHSDRVLHSLDEFFLPASSKAVGEALAGFASFFSKPRVRILWVGGRPGFFREPVIEQMRKKLSQKKIQLEVEAVESLASPESLAGGAEGLQLGFPDRHFDLVVGKNFHRAGKEGLPAALSEVARVLQPDGVFLHFQDHAPDPSTWAGDPAFGRLNVSESWSGVRRLVETSSAAHTNFVMEMARLAERMRLSNASFLGGASFLVPASRQFPKIEGHGSLSGLNHLHFNQGMLVPTKERNVPRRMKRLKYTAFFFIMSPTHRLTEMVRHFQRF